MLLVSLSTCSFILDSTSFLNSNTTDEARFLGTGKKRQEGKCVLGVKLVKIYYTFLGIRIGKAAYTEEAR
ncbi:MAG: hypothetical protein AAF620_08090 [Bacteroidota bacterium]